MVSVEQMSQGCVGLTVGHMQGPIFISRPLTCPIFSSLSVFSESTLLVLIYFLSE